MSTQTIASSINPNHNLELDYGLNINEVTAQASNCLGQNGHIHSATGHTCGECTHKYQKTVDVVPPDNELQNTISSSQQMDVDFSPVTMVVVDGIVMGPTVSML